MSENSYLKFCFVVFLSAFGYSCRDIYIQSAFGEFVGKVQAQTASFSTFDRVVGLQTANRAIVDVSNSLVGFFFLTNQLFFLE